jgi:hypothetical protein
MQKRSLEHISGGGTSHGRAFAGLAVVAVRWSMPLNPAQLRGHSDGSLVRNQRHRADEEHLKELQNGFCRARRQTRKSDDLRQIDGYGDEYKPGKRSRGFRLDYPGYQRNPLDPHTKLEGELGVPHISRPLLAGRCGWDVPGAANYRYPGACSWKGRGTYRAYSAFSAPFSRFFEAAANPN